MKSVNDFSFMSNAENQYLDDLYQSYQKNPQGVDESWQRFFAGFDYAQFKGVALDPESLAAAPGQGAEGAQGGQFNKELRVYRLIHAYRDRGHLKAKTNPIKERLNRKPGLELENFGLSEKDLKEKFQVGATIGLPGATLEEIINKMETIYASYIGIEYCHIKNARIREWIKEQWELSIKTTDKDTFGIPLEKRKRILAKLNEASLFENFLHTKYVGQKRFSLEGGENAIPAVDAMINEAAEHGVEEVVIGMAHRGRLNILANIMNKSYEEIFAEFEGRALDVQDGDGDVKYHLGFQTQHRTPQAKEVTLHLMPNPSHLETVGPVVAGYVRSKGDINFSGDYGKILPILIHGDAALAGQGVTYELAQMSKLEAYQTQGMIHFVINNQIGFTTDFWEGRSSHYCTQVAYISDSPVLHVNGDDADAVFHAVEFAVKFRQEFKQDVYVDMVCYRKYGHNEGDEPRFTQPLMYDLIKKHRDARMIYMEELSGRGEILAEMAQKMEEEFKELLQSRFQKAKEGLDEKPPASRTDWKQLRRSTPQDFAELSPNTAVAQKDLAQVHEVLCQLPSSIHPIKKIVKLLEERKQRWDKNEFDWALGELLAYGTLLQEGHDVRFSGQDVLRGTFTHRHAVLTDEKTGARYNPLNHLAGEQGQFRIHNSLLSEYAVLGFEYGYSLCHPMALTLWEAQFGDFANGAQIIIDQFISSAESKWQRSSGLVMLLPHGYEGQGPEHSSARAERYLQLAAEFNIIVANATTPANFFHLLRRQLKFPFRKPLIVLTPKKLLRHPDCISPREDFIQGQFAEFFDDERVQSSQVKRVLLCTGKIYYDLLARQKDEGRQDVAIVRLEQLHPIPFERFDQAMAKYRERGAEFFWVQEEPKNMGFWNYILRKLDYYNLNLISRKSSASTATGYGFIHEREQREIIEQAFQV